MKDYIVEYGNPTNATRHFITLECALLASKGDPRVSKISIESAAGKYKFSYKEAERYSKIDKL